MTPPTTGAAGTCPVDVKIHVANCAALVVVIAGPPERHMVDVAATAPPTVGWMNWPRTGAMLGKTTRAFGSWPALPNRTVVSNWPMLVKRRSLKIPNQARTTVRGAKA